MQTQKIILRWRVKEGKVLLLKRHIRELSHFELSPSLIAWVHERLEWADVNLLNKDTSGVMVLSIEPEGEAQVSFEECVPLATYGLEDVLVQEGLVAGLSMSEGVWPATVWLVDQDGTLVASASELYLATDTLVQQLATTQGFTVEVAPQLRAALDQAKAVFAVSDEFGFVPLIGNAEAAETLKKNLDSLFKG